MVIDPKEPRDGLVAYKEGWNDACIAHEIRIQKLEEMLRWYIEEDEINECDPENEYWIEGKHKAMRLLGMDVESN